MGEEIIRTSLENPTGNIWIDNGTVVLYQIFSGKEISVSDALNRLMEELIEETGYEDKYYDEETGEEKSYRKKVWVFPASVFINVKPKNKKKRINGKNRLLSPPVFELKLDFKRKGECDICGHKGKVTEGKGWFYPFIVVVDKFSNFYSGLKQNMVFCPKCAISGFAAYKALLYVRQGKDRSHFFMFHSELETLNNLMKHVIRPLSRTEGVKKGRNNIPVAFYGDYAHETALGLLLEMFKQLRLSEPESNEEVKLALSGIKVLEEIFEEGRKTLELHVFSGDITGRGTLKPSESFIFSEFKLLYRLYKTWYQLLVKRQIERPHTQIAQVFKQFHIRQNKNLDTLLRDKIAWAILELRDPSRYIEEYLYTAKKRLVYGSLDLFEHYWKEVIGMSEHLIEVLKKFGHILGEKVGEEEKLGILYSLRNAKNVDDYLKVLNDIQFKLELGVPDALFKIEKGNKISGEPWQRVKTLLSIYAMNQYLYKSKSKKQEVSTNE